MKKIWSIFWKAAVGTLATAMTMGLIMGAKDYTEAMKERKKSEIRQDSVLTESMKHIQYLYEKSENQSTAIYSLNETSRDLLRVNAKVMYWLKKVADYSKMSKDQLDIMSDMLDGVNNPIITRDTIIR